MAKDKLITLGDTLETVMDKIEALKAELKPLEEEEDAIREEIVKGLLKKGLSYVKCSSGLAFGITSGRTTFKVKKGEEQTAIKWALENYPSILSLTSAKLNQVVKPMLNPPEFLERSEGEPFLSVRTQETE